jgi:hypothetical protein
MRAREKLYSFVNGVGLTLIKAFNFKITSNILLHMISRLRHLLVNAVAALNNITTLSQKLRSAQVLPTDWTIRHEQNTYLSSETSIQALRPTQLPAHCTPAALSPELTWQGHEVDQPLPATTEVTNERSCASAPPSVCLHGMVFTFAFINIVSSLISMLLFEC